jgi:hypothetical protein
MSNKLSPDNIEKEGGAETPIGRITNEVDKAVSTGNIEPLIDILRSVNLDLTGFEKAHFKPGSNDLREILKRFVEQVRTCGPDDAIFSDMIYLGDGGYSRLGIDYDGESKEIVVYLSPSSTKEVTDKWNKMNSL